MQIVHTAEELSRARGSSRAGGGVFVPTMGALHEGHASLIRVAAAMKKAGCDGPVVVSIFVNPTQFTDAKDLERYPRTFDADAALCERTGADIIFAPSVETMYPRGVVVPVPPLPLAATRPGLEDTRRPGHFAGVCQIVARLFELVAPRAAIFGEKDYQQLAVVRAMTAALRLPIVIVPGPTVRETDGLAMSSRNRFLNPAERTQAAAVSAALREATKHRRVEFAERAMLDVLRDAGMEVDYAVVRDAATLMPMVDERQPGRALIAARLGSVRLIDNTAW